MKYRFIDQAKKEFPAHRLCRALGVSDLPPHFHPVPSRVVAKVTPSGAG